VTPPESTTPNSLPFAPRRADDDVLGRYRSGRWRPPHLYSQLILEDLGTWPHAQPPTVLDIGCGHGLMGEAALQGPIAALAGPYIGLEPDADAEPPDVFTRVWRHTLEEAPLPEASVDLAYSVMVLEHVREPAAHFAALARVLRPGGVFWGFTVDRRHYFSWLSQLFEWSGLKDRYLDRVRGSRGGSPARYDNFPTFYRCNSPRVLAAQTARHFSLQTWSLHRVGQLDGYMPYRLRRVSRLADRAILRLGLPGSVLAVRMVRR
jgi:SAM-dependent methyltransferase